MTSTTKAFIKSKNKIQLVSWNGEQFSKYAPTGEVLKIKYSYYPATIEASTALNSSTLELVRLIVFARLYEALGDVRMGIMFRNQYQMELIRWKKQNAGRDKVGRMTTYQV